MLMGNLPEQQIKILLGAWCVQVMGDICAAFGCVAQVALVFTRDRYFFLFLSLVPTSPNMPVPKRSMVAVSGTGATLR